MSPGFIYTQTFVHRRWERERDKGGKGKRARREREGEPPMSPGVHIHTYMHT